MTRKIKREIIEWGLLIAVVLGLYLTGSHTTVIGFFQRGILATGLFAPEMVDSENQLTVDYDFMLEDSKGNRVSFKSFAEKTVFVNIWATWCPPCVAEMPDIHGLYKKVGKEVSFVMIAQDKDFEKAKAYVEDQGYTFPVYKQITALPQAFQSRSIPATYVVSPQGRIVAKRQGMARYDTREFREFITSLR